MAIPQRKAEWRREQDIIREQIIVQDDVDWTHRVDQKNTLRLIGGLDVSFFKDGGTESHHGAIACLVVLTYPELQVVYEDSEELDMQIPYYPGFLGFRECPVFQKLLQRVALTDHNPQVLLVDGNGILHPRGCGSACHLGVLSGYPTIGVAKTLMYVQGLDEKHFKTLARDAGANTGLRSIPLVGSRGATLGAAVFGHGQGTVVPIYVSVGHRVSLETAVALVGACSKFRMPEPIRQADLRSRRMINRAEQEASH